MAGVAHFKCTRCLHPGAAVDEFLKPLPQTQPEHSPFLHVRIGCCINNDLSASPSPSCSAFFPEKQAAMLLIPIRKY